MTEKKEAITFRLEPKLLNAVDELAGALHITRSQLLRIALDRITQDFPVGNVREFLQKQREQFHGARAYKLDSVFASYLVARMQGLEISDEEMRGDLESLKDAGEWGEIHFDEK